MPPPPPPESSFNISQAFAAAHAQLDASLRGELAKTRAKLATGAAGEATSWPRIHQYELRGWLGAGAFGQVFRAWDPRLHRELAVKLLGAGTRSDPTNLAAEPADVTGGESDYSAAIREARQLARLSHRHIVQIYDVGTYAGRVYLATELVDGVTFHQWLADGPHPVEVILELFWQISKGLAAVHRVGLVHRDIKPSNLMLGDDGVARLADFGLVAEQPAAVSSLPNKLDQPAMDIGGTGLKTLASTAVGTPAYMAPEQWSGQPVDWRSDHYGLCLCMYEAIYAQRENRTARPTPPFAPVGRAGTRVPRGLRGALARGLAADPRARFSDPDALVRTLESLRSPRVNGHRGRTLGLASLLGIAAIGVTVAATRNGAHTSPEATTTNGLPVNLQTQVQRLIAGPNAEEITTLVDPVSRTSLSAADWADWLSVLPRSQCRSPDWDNAWRTGATWTVELECERRPLILQFEGSNQPPHLLRQISLLSRPAPSERAEIVRRIETVVNDGVAGNESLFDTPADERFFFLRLARELDPIQKATGRCAAGHPVGDSRNVYFEVPLTCENGEWWARVGVGFGDPMSPRDNATPPLRDMSVRPKWATETKSLHRDDWVPQGRTDRHE